MRGFCLVAVCVLGSCAAPAIDAPDQQDVDAGPDVVWQSFPGTNGRIAFPALEAVLEGSHVVIHTVSPDGTGRAPMPNPNGVAREWPSWSPTGRKMAFGSSPDTINWEIHSVNADGSCDEQLTTNPTPSNPSRGSKEPDWSPSGEQIAFQRRCDVFTMNADGTGVDDLTQPAGCGVLVRKDFCPAWSPDGTRIAFFSWRTGNAEIFIMNADGTNPVNVTNDSASDGCPEWSPDGTKLVFRSDRAADSTNDYFVMEVSTGSVSRLTNFAAGYLSTPAWSPNGARIAFVSHLGTNLNQFALYTMRATDGGGVTQVAEDAWTGDVDWGSRFGGVSVTWMNTLRVEVECNSLSKRSSAADLWNAGASSVETLDGDGALEFTTGENTSQKIAGLSSGDDGTERQDIDFGLYLRDDGALVVSEGSSFHKPVGTYAAGDVFRIRVLDGVVTYWQNGVRLYRSQVAPSFPLLVDTALRTPEATVQDVTLDAD